MAITLLTLYSPRTRTRLKLLLATALLLLLAAAAPIPFIWESTTLWYKIGVDKTLLQTGKVFGIFAAILLALQIVLASRQRLLDRIFGLDRVYALHRLNAYLLIAFGLFHFGLVILPEGVSNLPIGWKFWPEIIGAGVLVSLIASALLATFRAGFLPYHLWRKMHRPAGYLLALALPIHILFVSGTLDHAVPRYGLLTLAAAVMLAVVVRKIQIMAQKSREWHLRSLIPETEEIVRLEVTAPPSFAFAPGQFAVIQLHGGAISSEPHPFTIASAPASGDFLQFFIKRSGDWTSSLAFDAAGEISVEGPYGLFSYTARENVDWLILIAGGIGITPLLSMLRQIAAEPVQPRVTLIWSLDYRRQHFLKDELALLENDIASLDINMIYTREEGGGRLERGRLQNILREFDGSEHVYICGPRRMMKSVRGDMLQLGMARQHIFIEEFAL